MHSLHDGPESFPVHDLAGVGGLHSGLDLKVDSARIRSKGVLRLGPWTSESGSTTTWFADQYSDLLPSSVALVQTWRIRRPGNI